MSFLSKLLDFVGPGTASANDTTSSSTGGSSKSAPQQDNSSVLSSTGLATPEHQDDFGNGFSILSDTGQSTGERSLGGDILETSTNVVSGTLDGILSLGSAAQKYVVDQFVEPELSEHGGDLGQQMVENSNLNQEYQEKSNGPLAELVTKYGTIFGLDAVSGVASEVDKGVENGSKLHLALTEAGLLTAGEDMTVFEDYKSDVLAGTEVVSDGSDFIDDTLSQAVREVYPDQGNGGDVDAEGPSWLQTGLGWLHTGLDEGTQLVTHGSGVLTTLMGETNQVLGDGFQGLSNLGIDGLQTLGIGPEEETQSWLNERFDVGQEAQLDTSDTIADYLHNLAEPLGDVVADAGLQYGADFVQGGLNIGQNLGNLGIDLGQAYALIDNEVKNDHGEGVDPMYMEQAIVEGNLEQASTNEWFDTQQHKLDNTVQSIVDGTD